MISNEPAGFSCVRKFARILSGNGQSWRMSRHRIRSYLLRSPTNSSPLATINVAFPSCAAGVLDASIHSEGASGTSGTTRVYASEAPMRQRPRYSLLQRQLWEDRRQGMRAARGPMLHVYPRRATVCISSTHSAGLRCKKETTTPSCVCVLNVPPTLSISFSDGHCNTVRIAPLQ